MVTTLKDAPDRVCRRVDSGVRWAVERGEDRRCAWAAPVVLDIDIDTFSVQNNMLPELRAHLSEHDIQLLRHIFDPQYTSFASSEQERGYDRRLIRRINEGDLWSLMVGMLRWRTGWQLIHGLRILAQLPSEAWGGIFTLSIPEHISTDKEVDALLAQLSRLLKVTNMRPSIVTIARSVGSGFAPSTTARYIECKVLQVLEDHMQQYGGIEVTLPGDEKMEEDHCHAATIEALAAHQEVPHTSTLPENHIGWWLFTAIYGLMVQFPIWTVGYMALRLLNKGANKDTAPSMATAMRFSWLMACCSAILWALVGAAVLGTWLLRPTM